MPASRLRHFFLVLFAVAFAAPFISGAVASATASRRVALHPGTAPASPGTGLWVRRYDDPNADGVLGYGVASSSSMVFVAGYSSKDSTLTGELETVAYDATTGAQRWVSTYAGPGESFYDRAVGIALSPDGSKVFVLGKTWGATTRADFTTIALDAATGTTLWVGRYDGPAHRGDFATAITVSPDGSHVFVAGSSWSDRNGTDYALVAYNAETGAQGWVSRYDGPGHDSDTPAAVGISPDGTAVYETGTSYGSGENDLATVAYRTKNGSLLWVRRDGGPDGSGGSGDALAVGPDGSTVYVAGTVGLADGTNELAAVAYGAFTGDTVWEMGGGGAPQLGPTDAAVAPDGSRLFITGSVPSAASPDQDDYGTLALQTSSGGFEWTSTYDDPAHGNDNASALAVSPDGLEVFVTGWSEQASSTNTDYGTVAYAAATGTADWVRRLRDGVQHCGVRYRYRHGRVRDALSRTYLPRTPRRMALSVFPTAS
jgi:hypothetical protein